MEAKRRRISELLHADHTVQEVASMVKCSKGLVFKVKRLEKDGKGLARSKGSGGHNKVVNEDFLDFVKATVDMDRMKSIRTMAKENRVCPATMCKTMKKLGLRSSQSHTVTKPNNRVKKKGTQLLNNWMNGSIRSSVTTLMANRFLFNFQTLDNLSEWHESSDTVRTVGMSKATMTLQKTQVFQRAIFFALLNPQPNGAGFAGFRTRCYFDLSEFNHLSLNLRARGDNDRFKVVLSHNNEASDGNFEQVFKVDTNAKEFQEIILPLDKFEFYFRGRLDPNHEPLNKKKITDFGFQVFGGVYESFKQSGVSSLEIDWVKAG